MSSNFAHRRSFIGIFTLYFSLAFNVLDDTAGTTIAAVVTFLFIFG
jgi:hypothetical protein